MTVSQLTSRHNPLLKRIRWISSGSIKAQEPCVAAEGIRVLEEASRSNWEIEAVIFASSFGSTARESHLLDIWQTRGVRLYKIAEKLFESISSVKTPQGAIALVRVRKLSLDMIRLQKDALIILACAIQDPGNLGTLIRTAAAAGASLVCTTTGTVSARNPKSIRSSAGAFFSLPLLEHVSIGDFERYCDSNAIRIYRTDAHEGVLYTEADLRSSCAILLGNEGSGMSEQALVKFPAIRIPMAAGVESLNVAMAGAVIMFEASRQRQSTFQNKSKL